MTLNINLIKPKHILSGVGSWEFAALRMTFHLFQNSTYSKRRERGARTKTNALLFRPNHPHCNNPWCFKAGSVSASREACSCEHPTWNRTHDLPLKIERDWPVGNWQSSGWSSRICLWIRKLLGCQAITFCSTHCCTPPLISAFNPDEQLLTTGHSSERESVHYNTNSKQYSFTYFWRNVSLISFDLHKIYFYLYIFGFSKKVGTGNVPHHQSRC